MTGPDVRELAAGQAAGAWAAMRELDSGVGTERWDAHALYFAHGLRTGAHHFQTRLSG